MIASSTPLAALALLLSGSALLPLVGEEEFGNTPVQGNEEWAKGVLAVANDSRRTYRRWVNGNEEFFFSGNTQQVNAALERFAQIEADVREVVLLPYAGSTVSFEDKPVAYDWRLYAPSGICLARARNAATPVYPVHATLTVHITGKIWLRNLDLPAGVSLVGYEELAGRYREAIDSADENLRATAAHAYEQLEMQIKPRNEDQARRNEALREYIEATRGVELELAFDDGEQRFTAAIVNRRSVPITIVLPGDGSEPDSRTPYIDWDVRNIETGEDRRMGWIGCGTFDPMRADEIVTIAPGDRQPIPVQKRIRPPGRYSVVLRYDNDPKRGIIRGQDSPDVLALVRSSDRLILVSHPIEITVR